MRYLAHALNSPQHLTVVDAHGSGSTKTSRNRLRQAYFESLKVVVPTNGDDLHALVELMDAADALRADPGKSLEHAKNLRDNLTVFIPEP